MSEEEKINPEAIGSGSMIKKAQELLAQHNKKKEDKNKPNN